MKIEDLRNHEREKTCHLRPGECVHVFGSDGNQIPGTFLVCSAGTIQAKLGSSGLYRADVPVFLVSLETGEARALPNLSSRLTEKVKIQASIL